MTIAQTPAPDKSSTQVITTDPEIGPVAFVPLWMIEHPEMAPSALMLYIILAGKYADSTTGRCVVKQRTLAADLRCTQITVQRNLRILTRVGALIRETQQAQDGSQLCNVYSVVPANAYRTSAPRHDERHRS